MQLLIKSLTITDVMFHFLFSSLWLENFSFTLLWVCGDWQLNLRLPTCWADVLPLSYTSAPCTLTLKQQTLLSVLKAIVFVLLLHTCPWWERSLQQLLRWEVSHSWLLFWEGCTPSNLSTLIKSEMTHWVKGLAMQAWPLSLILVEGEKAAPTSTPLSSIHVQ